MRLKRGHWLLVASTSLLIGCSTALIEIFTSEVVDLTLPDVELVTTFRRPGTITLLSLENEIIQKIGPATREKVSKEELPERIKEAFIAAEDRRFYNHKGVDLWGIIRALLINVREREFQEGGSTITQQLARTVFLSQEQTFKRKVKEAGLAYKIERHLSKEEILAHYLNSVYLGSGAYGIADASWIYFSKKPAFLSIDEIALLAGLAPAPSLYSPLINAELAIERRSIVLNKMLKEGFISISEFNQAIKSPLNLQPAKPKFFDSKAPFFTSWALQELPLLLSKEQIEIGGLQIRTSLNLTWQRKAKEVISQEVPNELESALVSIQPSTGLVRVLIGGKDFESNQFNRATIAKRSPGSTFKLFPYAAAISEGFNPNDQFIDKPRCWKAYCPKNFGDKYMGKVSLSDAFTNSLNTVAVELLDTIGFEKVISTAQKLGIGNDRELGNYYPLAIGAYEQTVLDMTAAYAGVTNRGLYLPPIPFEEIRGPENKILWSHKTHKKQAVRALNQEVADTMNWMLQQVVSEGTGKVASLENRPVAGKTGTSEGGRDLWFIGSLPELTTGIWLGFDDNKKTKIGSGEAAWVWKKFILKIESELPLIEFPKENS